MSNMAPIRYGPAELTDIRDSMVQATELEEARYAEAAALVEEYQKKKGKMPPSQHPNPGGKEASMPSTGPDSLQSEVPKTQQHTPKAPCASFNTGNCPDSQCPKSHEPDNFSIQLVRGLPNLCKSYFLYHMSCTNTSCPYSHNLQASGMPLNRPSLFPTILAEFRKTHGALENTYEKVEALLNSTPKFGILMYEKTIHDRLMGREKKAVVFSPMGPVICKKHLLNSGGCTVSFCCYSHDLSGLGLTLRSKEEALKLFDDIKAYWDWGSAVVTHKVFLTELPGGGREENQVLRGLNGAEILHLLKTGERSLELEARDLLISKQGAKHIKAQTLSNEPVKSTKEIESSSSNEPIEQAKVTSSGTQAEIESEPLPEKATAEEIYHLANQLAEAVQIPGLTGEDILAYIERKEEKISKQEAEREAKKELKAQLKLQADEELIARLSLDPDYGKTVLIPKKATNVTMEESSSGGQTWIDKFGMNPTAPDFALPESSIEGEEKETARLDLPAPTFVRASENLHTLPTTSDSDGSIPPKATAADIALEDSYWDASTARPATEEEITKANGKAIPRFFRNRPKVSYQEGEIVGGEAPALGEGNKGLAMLEKMGWKRGEALGKKKEEGDGDGGRNLTPLEMKVRRDRKGL